MRKGFTLIELIMVISIMSIIASIAAISYKYNIDRAREHCASAQGQEIIEAVIWSYEHNDNLIDRSKLIMDVKNITGFDIHVKETAGKTVVLDYIYEAVKYDINADLVYYKFNIHADIGGKVIYDY